MAIQANVGARIGDYILVRKLGEGGMAEVWLAKHVVSAQLRAIKFLNSQFQGIPEVEARFQNEGESKLIHPNIVRIYEVGQESGSSYLVMEFVDGQDLENILNSRRGPLTVPESLDIGTQILSGLGFAHSNGIIHRDIKPSNVLVDPDGHAFVMDFGIAKVLRTGRMLTQINSRLGTPDYMSPEQIRNPRDVDHRSDIYSFGCLFYELLTGWPPFDRGEGYETEHDIKTAHVTQPPTPPMMRKTGLPPELNQITLRCLEKAKEDRPQSCEEIIAALNAYRITIARPLPTSRSATVIETAKPSAGPGTAQRRETVVLPQGGATETPEFKPVETVVPLTGAKQSGFGQQVRTPTLVDTVQAGKDAGIVTPIPKDTGYVQDAGYSKPRKQSPTALIAAGILLVLTALGGGGWLVYHKLHEDEDTNKVVLDTNKSASDTNKSASDGKSTDGSTSGAGNQPNTNSKPGGQNGSSTQHPAMNIPELGKTHGKPAPNAANTPLQVDSPRPKVSGQLPSNQGIPHAASAPLSGTLIWTGDATATRGHVTIVRSDNFAIPGGQLTGAMFPAAPLRVTVRTPGATVQLPKQQTSYNSLDLFLPSPGQQTVYIDWTALSAPQ